MRLGRGGWSSRHSGAHVRTRWTWCRSGASLLRAHDMDGHGGSSGAQVVWSGASTLGLLLECCITGPLTSRPSRASKTAQTSRAGLKFSSQCCDPGWRPGGVLGPSPAARSASIDRSSVTSPVSLPPTCSLQMSGHITSRQHFALRSSVTKDAAGITDTLSGRPRRIPLLSCPRARPPSTRQRGSGQLEVQLGGNTSTGPLDLLFLVVPVPVPVPSPIIDPPSAASSTAGSSRCSMFACVPFARRMPECALECPDARLRWLSACSASSRCESPRLIALWNDDQLSVLSRTRRQPKAPGGIPETSGLVPSLKLPSTGARPTTRLASGLSSS